MRLYLPACGSATRQVDRKQLLREPFASTNCLKVDLSVYLLYIAKSFSNDNYFLMELHIRDVSKTYSNGVQALKDVTLTITHAFGKRRTSGPTSTSLLGMISLCA